MNEISKRRDIGYSIISRFEQTHRKLLSEKLSLLFSEISEGIPKGILDRIEENKQRDSDGTIVDFLEATNFLDLKEISIFKGLYRYYFLNERLPKEEYIKLMDSLYNLRCKIAHARGLFGSIEIDELFESCREIANAMDDYGTDLLTFFDNLEDNPNKYLITMPKWFEYENSINSYLTIPNNLPTPDYEFEGGFVGREEDIKKITTLVNGNLHRVITITGAGGVGKTALALKVIQRIIEQSQTKYDGIIWVSAKENKLSVLGIEDIEPTLRNYEELLDTILEIMGYGVVDGLITQKETDVNTIFDIHKNILIVIDNLETITDDRIIDFVVDAHPNLKILITSRRGLGQVERRYELNQLKEKEAIVLFRQLAKDKKLESLSRLDNDTIKTYVNKVACYPLAIKWVIGHVALGKDINSLVDKAIEQESDIAHFCFDQVFSSLSSNSKKVLCVLSLYDSPPTSGVLQYVTNISQMEFENCIRELVLVSLVIPNQENSENEEISTRFSLLSLTRGFVRNQLDQNIGLKNELEDRMRTVQGTIEEAERAKRQYKFSLFNLGASTEEEKVSSMLLQTAYQKYQAGSYPEALLLYKRASEISPRFSSIYRNWAVMESNEGHSVEADKLMQRASKLSPSDPQIWLIWGNIKRKEEKIRDALKYYLKARELAPDDYVVLNALGQAKSRNGEYEEADELFNRALVKLPDVKATTPMKHEIINRTSLAENLKRWAEALVSDRNHKEAIQKLESAINHCEKALTLDESDTKTATLFRNLHIQYGYAIKKNDSENAVKHFKMAIVSNPRRYKEIKDSIRAIYEIIKICQKEGNLEVALAIFDYRIAKQTQRTDPQTYRKIQSILLFLKRDGATEGKIINVNAKKGFCIIESANALGDTFLGHVSNFVPEQYCLDESILGKLVSFFPENNNSSEKKKAISIKILDS